MDLITFAKAQAKPSIAIGFGGYWDVYSRVVSALSAREGVQAASILAGDTHPVETLETFADAILRLRLAVLVNDVAEAQRHCEYLQQHEMLKEPLAQAVADFHIGTFHRQCLHFASALNAQARAASIFREMDWKLEEALCDIEIGSVFLQRGDLSGAVGKYMAALEVLREHGTSTQYGRLLLNIAVNIHRAGNHEQAASQYDRLLSIEPYSTLGVERAQVLQRYAALSKQVGLLDRAAEQYAEALECLTDRQLSAQYADLVVGLADLAIRRGDIEHAKELLSGIDERALTLPARIEFDAARAYMMGVAGLQHEAYTLLSATLEKTHEAGLTDQRHSLLNDALSWAVDERFRINILEQYRLVQDQRLQSVATGVNAIVDIRTHYEQERSRLEIDRQQELSRVIVETQTRTMSEIGRELHDSIGQDLTVLLRLSERMLDEVDASPQERSLMLKTIRDVGHRASSDARRIAHLLADGGISGRGLVEALSVMRDEIYQAVPQLDLQVIVTGNLDEMSNSGARAMYRVIQTLLQNVIKHSRARTCTVNIVAHDDHYHLGVEDDGIGFVLSSVRGGMGLREMRARVELAGGSIRVESVPQRGTYIEVMIPR